jgi:hypothetical protein
MLNQAQPFYAEPFKDTGCDPETVALDTIVNQFQPVDRF